MLDDPSFEPAALAEQLARLIRERPNKRRLLLGGIAAVALLAALAAILAVVLTDDAASPGSYSPPARITARIPLGAPATALAASSDAVWAATPSGALIKVDVSSESVVGAPLKMFSDNAYVTLAVDEDTLWAGGPGLLAPPGLVDGGRALQKADRYSRGRRLSRRRAGAAGHAERRAEPDDRADRARS